MMALKGWVVQTRGGGRIQRDVIAPAGREALRQMLRSPRQRSAVPGPSTFADAHPVHEDAQPVHGMAEAQAAFDHVPISHTRVEDRVIEDPRGWPPPPDPGEHRGKPASGAGAAA